MRNLHGLVAALAALAAGAAGPTGAQEGPSGRAELSLDTNYVRVSGRRAGVDGSEALRLDVEFLAGSEFLIYDGLLVYAEPSHTLLLEQSNTASWSGERPARRGRAALLENEGDLRDFRAGGYIPYGGMRAGQDRRIVVEVLHGDARYRVAEAVVNTAAFDFSTEFTQAGPFEPTIQGYRHCCRGNRCSQMCTDCTCAFFFCDLITCQISCECM